MSAIGGHDAPSAGVRWALRCAAAAVALFAAWEIASTYTLLSHTVDEPTHIAAGLEWIERGTNRLHPENPPLSRIAIGLAAHLDGHRLPSQGRVFQRGTEVLYQNDDYERSLAHVRSVSLPFLLVTILIVWLWAHRLGGDRAAFVAVAAYATLPPVMGHAGLATTDTAFSAAFALAAFTGVLWLEKSSFPRALGFGVSAGLAVATKFSALAFLPPGLLGVWALQRIAGRRSGLVASLSPWKRRVAGAALVALAALLVFWGSYDFSIGTLGDRPETAGLIAACCPEPGSALRWIAERLTSIPVPAPDGLAGLLFLLAHSVRGHPAYLLGETSQHGFLSFYPIALAVKSPLPFLLLLATGLATALRETRWSRWTQWAPAIFAAGALAAATASSIHMGVRHVLVVYPLLSIAAGAGCAGWLADSREPKGRMASRLGVALVAALLVWQIAIVVLAKPNYLGWFNETAGSDPGRILVDSDLDWGQDLFQLEALAKRYDIDLLHIAVFGSLRLCDHGLPPLVWLPPGRPVTGWVAVSEMYYRDLWHLSYDDACNRLNPRASTIEDGYSWLADHEPIAIAGRSIRLYRIADR